MNPANMPELLRPFLPLFEKWGNVASDTGRHAMIDRALADSAEMQELRGWHEKLQATGISSCQEWIEGPINPLDENYERAKVYFTF